MADELNITLPYEGEVKDMEGNKDQRESERESETEDETNFKRQKGSGKINAADPEKQLTGPSLMTASGTGKGKKPQTPGQTRQREQGTKTYLSSKILQSSRIQ